MSMPSSNSPAMPTSRPDGPALDPPPAGTNGPDPGDAGARGATSGGGALTPRPSTPRPASGMPVRRSELATELGRTSIADSVVAKIAGLACREVSGVHEMGAGTARAFGSIRDRISSSSSDSQSALTRGVGVEVGERQAAVDLDIVVDYGVAIVDVAESIRRNVIGRVESMTGLQVTEVNVSVDDVYLGEPDEPEQPRVR